MFLFQLDQLAPQAYCDVLPLFALGLRLRKLLLITFQSQQFSLGFINLAHNTLLRGSQIGNALFQFGDLLLLLKFVILQSGGLLLNVSAEFLELRISGLTVLACLLGTCGFAVQRLLRRIQLHLDRQILLRGFAQRLVDLRLA